MKKIIMACFLSVLCLQGFAHTGFDADYNAALKRAKDNSKPIFILFTGSDWCSWCVKFEKEVLSKSEFLDYATNTWELVVADFPQKKKIAPELKKQYQALQKKYAVRGFPTVMLIDAKGKELCSAGYSKGGAKVWLEKFLNKLKITPLVEQYLAPIEKKVRAIGEESRDEITANV
ncbi:MAG: thioredoxin family protein, partial [Kiritimatiellae bacterium]|nr:thioredoxin family protein [Kiritimatiellia bacterium]